MATVLVVDDWEFQREYLRLLFEHAGHVVLEAENGDDALRKTHSIDLDLVFTDVVMPGTDGIDFIRRIRERDEMQNLPVVFYTAAYDDQNTLEFAKHYSSVTILPKPAEPDAVLRALEAALSLPANRFR